MTDTTSIRSRIFTVRGHQCYWVTEEGPSIAITEDDAKLINSFPELLSAFKEVVRISDRKHDAWNRAHAAIAKAEGNADAE